MTRSGLGSVSKTHSLEWSCAHLRYAPDSTTDLGTTESIVAWVVCVTSNLLPSQSRTRAALVAAAVRLERVNLALLGRKMAGAVTAKAAIKRAWRFTYNRRVEVSDAMAGVIQRVARKRKKPLLISFDWTDIKSFHTLMAAACIGGRAVPLVWASYTEAKLRRSQNSLEERLLRKLRALIPGSVPVIILADRGFGRAEWAAVCQELGFRYVVRIKPDVTVSCPRYRGVLREYPAQNNSITLLSLHNPRGAPRDFWISFRFQSKESDDV
jgi:hypothetical protein